MHALNVRFGLDAQPLIERTGSLIEGQTSTLLAAPSSAPEDLDSRPDFHRSIEKS